MYVYWICVSVNKAGEARYEELSIWLGQRRLTRQLGVEARFIKVECGYVT